MSTKNTNTATIECISLGRGKARTEPYCGPLTLTTVSAATWCGLLTSPAAAAVLLLPLLHCTTKRIQHSLLIGNKGGRVSSRVANRVKGRMPLLAACRCCNTAARCCCCCCCCGGGGEQQLLLLVLLAARCCCLDKAWVVLMSIC